MTELLKFKRRNQVPPGHKYTYVDPDTKIVIEKPSWPAVLAAASSHRTANLLDIPPDFEAVVEDNCCRQIIGRGFLNVCVHAQNEWIPAVIGLTLRVGELVRGTLTIGNHVLRGRKVIAQEEANARALTCAGCDANVPHEECAPCNMRKVENAIKRIVGGRTTPHDGRLQACYWCGCFLKAKVWVPLDIVQSFQSDRVNESLPDKCWGKRKPV